MKRFKTILYLADSAPSHRQGLDRAVAPASANQARLTPLDVTERVTVGAGLGQHDGPDLTETRAGKSECFVSPVTLA